ncbi:beta-carbonic anhydrase, cab [Glarea lozoyensis ATCC 20868]|uniref:Carbonic anhydrase n=1 Tax=Glarea lozoyensis (strain ATCC 20868 / MF5171) TaxID=1116229 RepID=S3CGB9_GLAL2|nr:beta-carbonic anhydrase, cab [Glarea lozoyensis ATCC 20868]EPE24950.1 beta-carbonic anhydrase, cab [Glarea lozoyensis ATCC 20868]
MASQRFQDMLGRNEKFVETYTMPPTLQQIKDNAPPGRGTMAIISCSDPRVCPEEFLGIKRGEALVIRNAGGRAVEAIRSLEVMGTIGAIQLIVVIHHTDCGGLFTCDDEVRRKLGERAPEHKHLIENKNFGTFQEIGIRQSILDDVEVIKNWKFLPEYTEVKGFAYTIEDGKLTELV